MGDSSVTDATIIKKFKEDFIKSVIQKYSNSEDSLSKTTESIEMFFEQFNKGYSNRFISYVISNCFYMDGMWCYRNKTHRDGDLCTIESIYCDWLDD